MSHLHFLPRLLGLWILLFPGLSGLFVVRSGDIDMAEPVLGICSESDRFGVGVAGGLGSITDYDVESLHIGWYHSFTHLSTPPTPHGLEFVQTIRVSDDGPFAERECSRCPTWSTLSAIAQGNPGSLWLIGNEPDRQDYTSADRYAEIYHNIYTHLKAAEPTTRIGIGGVVQPTPIRIEYLDLILTAYQTKYATSMPVDVWNVHNYVLREADDWGAGYPPDTNHDLAIEYGIQDHDMLNPDPFDPTKIGWKQHIVLMRQWMHDRGYRDRPLIVSEYGILMPEIYGFDYPRVRDYMYNTFHYLRTATNASIGYPADGNRLVQAWAWYSLNDPAFEGFVSWNHLFDPETKDITSLGQDFGDYTNSLTEPYAGTVDLQPTGLWHDKPAPVGAGLVTLTLTAEIYNGGAETAQNITVRFEQKGTTIGENTIPSLAPGATDSTNLVWTNVPRGQRYNVTIIADPDGQIVECDPYNNRLTVPILVTDHYLYLPLIRY